MSLQLEIRVPDSVLLDTPVDAVQAQDSSGRFGLLSHHEPFLTLMVSCVLLYREEGGRERYAAVDGGVLLLENDHISIVTREAALADQLEDIANTAAAMLEARRQQERTARTEFAELQTSLLRELRKLEVRPT